MKFTIKLTVCRIFIFRTHRVSLSLQEQVELAVKYNADYMVAETIHYYGEAKLALEAIKNYGKGKFLNSVLVSCYDKMYQWGRRRIDVYTTLLQCFESTSRKHAYIILTPLNPTFIE